jgi:ribose 5-phosphate isomerase B
MYYAFSVIQKILDPLRNMKVAIASDHAGYREKEAIKKQLEEMGIGYEDLGTDSADVSVDYPIFGEKVALAVAAGAADRGIVICGSGIGISIAAKKVPGIRAALAWNRETAELARHHNDANVLAIGGRTTSGGTIRDIVDAFLTNEFDGGRHGRRVQEIEDLDVKFGRTK